MDRLTNLENTLKALNEEKKLLENKIKELKSAICITKNTSLESKKLKSQKVELLNKGKELQRIKSKIELIKKEISNLIRDCKPKVKIKKETPNFSEHPYRIEGSQEKGNVIKNKKSLDTLLIIMALLIRKIIPIRLSIISKNRKIEEKVFGKFTKKLLSERKQSRTKGKSV